MRILLTILSFTCCYVFGQSPRQRIQHLDQHKVDLAIAPLNATKFPFGKITVIDNRFDTSKIGYCGAQGSYHKLLTEGSFSRSLGKALERSCINAFDPNSGSVFHVFIRHYWLNHSDVSEMSRDKIDDETAQTFVNCQITLECFLETDSAYYPVIRFDTLLVVPRGVDDGIADMASASFNLFLNTLEKVNWNKRAKKMSEAQMLEFVNRNKNVDKSVLQGQPGIYRTFADFKAGKVDTVKFRVKNDVTDELFVIENGQEKLLEDFWGYTDGKRKYLYTGLNFFELVPAGDTYEIWGKKMLMRRPSTYANTDEGNFFVNMAANVLKGSAVNKYSRPLQLNMETGFLY